MSWLNKLVSTLRPRRLDAALDDELQFHIEQRALDLIARGRPPDEARREAALLFGNRTLLRELTRDRDSLLWLQTALQDLRFGARTLRRKPGFALAAVLSLALGIGANAALFSLLDGLLLRSLPVAEPHRLVRILVDGRDQLAYPTFDRLGRDARLLGGTVAMVRYFRPDRVEERGELVAAILQPVSCNYFDVLGVGALRGRVFHAGDARSPEGPMAVISEAYWRAHYRGDPGALGEHFRYANRDFTIVGIAQQSFRGMNVDGPADIWVPLEQTIAASGPMWTTVRWLQVMARLRPGSTRAAAAAEASALLRKAVTLEPGGTGFSTLRGRFARPLVVLECMVVLVLLIACANLANLMLADAAARRPELALRQAIGAGRARLVRQLFTESLLISFVGMLAGLGVAEPVSRAMLRYLPPDSVPARITLSFHASPRVLAFTAVLSMVTCLLFALAPAIRATGPALAPAMKRAGGGWISRLLIVGQVGMCTLLLIGAGLFVRSLRNLQHLDTGFSAEHVMVADLDMPRNFGLAQRRQRLEALRTQAAALPGVRNAALSHVRPLSGFAISGDIQNQPIFEQHVSPGFFATMGTPLLLGRDFTDRDDANSPPVAIVNESFARQFLPRDHPLGRRFGFEIAGVVKDTRWVNLRDKPPPMYYRPYLQWAGTPATLIVRGATTALELRRIAHSIDPNLALKDVTPFPEMEDRTLTTERMVAQGSAAFGLLALLVACVGLYGVLAYAVARRTREIGVRMALGASRAGIQWMVLRESLLLLVFGFAIGVPAALTVTRYTSSMLFGLTAADPLTISSVLAILLLAALAATSVPARRAASVDPLIALRYE